MDNSNNEPSKAQSTSLQDPLTNNQLQASKDDICITPKVDRNPSQMNQSNVNFPTALWQITVNSLVVTSVYLINILAKNACYYLIKDMGNTYTSAFGVGMTFLNIFCIAIIVSLNIGFLINSSKAYGEKNYRKIGQYLHKCFIINFIVLIPVTLIILYSKDIFLRIGYEVEVASLLHSYLQTSLLGLWLFIGYNTFSFYLNSMKIFKIQSIIQVTTAITFFALSAIFIKKYHLGLKGIAYAYNIQNFLNLIAIIVYIVVTKPMPESLFWFTRESFKGIWSSFKNELQIGSAILCGWLAEEFNSFVSGSLGAQESAAFLCVMASILIQQSFRIGSNDTSSTYMGNSIGEKNQKNFKIYLKSTIYYVLFYSLIGLVLVEFLSKEISQIYLSDEKAIVRASIMNRVMAVSFLTDGLFNIVTVVSRVLGFPTPISVIAFASAFFIGFPIGIYLAFSLKYNAMGLVIGYQISSVFAFIGCLIYAKYFADVPKRLKEQIEKQVLNEEKGVALLKDEEHSGK